MIRYFFTINCLKVYPRFKSASMTEQRSGKIVKDSIALDKLSIRLSAATGAQSSL